MKKRCQGFGIIELLISSVLGMFLLLGVFSLYQHGKRYYQEIYATAILQNNAQLLLAVLQQQIQQAGFVGCQHINLLEFYRHNKAYSFTAENKLEGYSGINNHWSPALPFIPNKIKQNTDVLAARYQDTEVIPMLSHNEKQAKLAYKINWQKNIPVIISDCQKAELVELEKASVNSVNIYFSQNLKARYPKHAMVAPFNHHLFYIRDTGRRNQSKQIIWGWYYQPVTGPAIEILPGLEDLKFYFRLKDQENYLTAAQISDWQNVISVKIHALLISDEEVLQKPQRYKFMGQEYLAKDKRLRQEWRGYVALRNS